MNKHTTAGSPPSITFSGNPPYATATVRDAPEGHGIEAEMDDFSILSISAGVGRKDDSGKPRLDLLPPELMIGTAHVMAFGAEKYAPRNWELGMDWGRVYGALLRHLLAWWGGEATDPETGLSHLSHASCCMAFLMAYEARGTGVDDRPLKGGTQ